MENPKILIVDDEPNILLYLSEALEDSGYDIVTKGNGKEALTSLEIGKFDLMLVDLKLKDISGLEVMREAKKRSPEIVVIMLTGHGSLESAIEAIRFGASDYLLKPSTVSDLKASIKRGLDKRQEELEQKRLAQHAQKFARTVISGGNNQENSQNSDGPNWQGTGRKGSIEEEEVIHVSDVIVDERKHEVKRGGEMLNLTPTEFNLLVTLMNNAGRVLSCKYLVKQVHNYDLSEFDSRSMIRVHIKHLRHKIENDPNNPKYILNVRGLGYKFGS